MLRCPSGGPVNPDPHPSPSPTPSSTPTPDPDQVLGGTFDSRPRPTPSPSPHPGQVLGGTAITDLGLEANGIGEASAATLSAALPHATQAAPEPYSNPR